MSQAQPRSDSPLEEPSGMLPKDPPARAARMAGWLLLLLSAVAVVFAALFKLPETVVAPFVMLPVDGADPVRAQVAGELASVHVEVGQRVKAGDELFRLRSGDVRNGNTRLKRLEEEQRSLVEKSIKLEESHSKELAIKDAEIAQVERELKFRDQHLATASELLKKAETLAAQGLISEVELLEHRLTTAGSEKDRVLAEKSLQQLKLQKQEKEIVRIRLRGEEKSELEKLRLEVASLKEQLVGSAGEMKSVTAPYEAYVLNVSQRTPGSLVVVGTELCQLARVDSRVHALLKLPESGVPRLRQGQTVRLFFDAFPYQRHGSVAAVVSWISPAAVARDGESKFQAMASLKQEGEVGLPVKAGMAGEARILVGRRTLIERAIEPLRAVRERVFTH